MSVGLISLCSFMTGVGSCAAFQGALKTGERTDSVRGTVADFISYPQLANTPRHGNGLSTICLWLECLLLHINRWYCVPRGYLKPTYAAVSSHITTRPSLHPLPQRGRSTCAHYLRRPANK
jgi:hypothetical protein